MKILLFTATLGPGGAERVLTLLARGLAARGHDITLLTVSGAERDFHSAGPSVRRIGLGMTGASSGIFDGMAANISRVRAVRAVFLREKPHGVISFLESPNVLALASALGTKIPVIISERTDPRVHRLGRSWQILRRILYPRAARLVVQTKSVLEWASAVMPASRVAVIPNPVIRPASPAQHRASPTPINIVGMGRMDQYKGFDVLIQAVKVASNRGVNLLLSLYGDGPERPRLEKLAADLGMTDRVAFPGRTKDPAAALANADIFVLSSRYEGFPNVLLEAMAVGTAVIAFDCPSGPAEIVENGVSGLLVRNGDLDRLSEAIVRVATDAPLRSALASAAFARAAAFDPDKIVEQWESILTDAVISK
jgi:GalNAc-alpha-(1->4)-GalNAc-alpha-(1->3)-diNAcBac-PP-undecaprenol alpha-1,4-N-acetyl-D-galactosaminyltransferase